MQNEHFEILEEGKSSKIVIMLHGIFSTMHESGRFDRQSQLHISNGYQTIRYDLPAHGARNTQSQTFQISQIVQEFYRVYCKYQHFSELNLVASSFGASIFLLALQCFDDIHFHRIVLLNPVTDYKSLALNPKMPQMKEVFRNDFWRDVNKNGSEAAINGVVFDRVNFVEFSLFDPKSSIDLLDDKTLVIHGTHDTAISFEECFSNFSKNKAITFFPVKNANHAFTDKQSEAISFDLIQNWLKGNSV